MDSELTIWLCANPDYRLDYVHKIGRNTIGLILKNTGTRATAHVVYRADSGQPFSAALEDAKGKAKVAPEDEEETEMILVPKKVAPVFMALLQRALDESGNSR